MLDTVRILYEYTLKNRVPAFLVGEEYEEQCRVTERQEEKLRKLLPPEGQQPLADYSSDIKMKGDMEMEAMFQAAFSLGMELSRL